VPLKKSRRHRSRPSGCQAVIALLTEYLEGGLAGAELIAFEAHLRGCAACSQYFATLKTTQAAVAHLRCDALPEEVHTRLRAFLRLRAAPSR